MTMGDTTNQSKEKGRAPARKGYPDSNAGKKTNLNLVKGVNEIKNTAIPKPLDVDSTRLPIVSTGFSFIKPIIRITDNFNIFIDPTIRPFFFGNPFVENFTGVFHFYEKRFCIVEMLS
jgi:hypothetical protein